MVAGVVTVLQTEMFLNVEEKFMGDTTWTITPFPGIFNGGFI